MKKTALTLCLILAAGTAFAADMPKEENMMQKQDGMMQKPAMKPMKDKDAHMKMQKPRHKKRAMSSGMK